MVILDEELAEASRQSLQRVEKAERALGAHERGLRRFEEHFKGQEAPCLQLEGMLLNLERQVNEQQVATEVPRHRPFQSRCRAFLGDL